MTGSSTIAPATSGAQPPATGVPGQSPELYPGAEVGQATLPVDNSYPGASQATVSSSEGAYPMPGSQATSAIPATSLVSGQSAATPSATTPVASPTTSATVTVNQPSPSATITKQAGPGTTQASGTTQQSATATLTLPAQNQTATSTPVLVITATPSPTSGICCSRCFTHHRQPNSTAYAHSFTDGDVFCADLDPRTNSDTFPDPHADDHIYTDAHAHALAGAPLGERPVTCHRSTYRAAGGGETAIDRILCLLERSQPGDGADRAGS